MRVKTILRNDGVCVCPSCDREWSAMMGENEMPEFCPDCSTENKATGPGMCPKCGSTKIDDCGQEDYDGEVMVYLSKCKDCGIHFWEGYTMTWAASSYNEEE